MKRKFIAKTRRKRYKKKLFLFILIFIISIYITFRLLLNSNIKIDNKEFVKLLLNEYNHDKHKINLSNYNITKLLNTSYYNIKSTNKIRINNKNHDINSNYIIYIYNTHQSEEYSAKTFLEQSVRPTVMMADYIMQDVFNKNGLNTLVEERSIKEGLNNNNWKYYRSYDVSRMFLEDVVLNNKSLTYFIDVHRDSLSKDKTTISISDKSYAKIVFIVGLENPNYNENLSLMDKINNKLNEKYPNLSKGIYKKSGAGVNGVYNQDFSSNVILVEIGGVDNTPDEVLNSTLAFTECFMEVISNNEG